MHAELTGIRALQLMSGSIVIPYPVYRQDVGKKPSGAAEEAGLLMPETVWAVPMGPPPPLLFPLPLVAQYSPSTV